MSPFEDDNSIKLDKFENIEYVGHGAFGKIYKALNIKTQEIWALKVLSKINSDFISKKFKEEAIFLSQFRHPNIIKFYELITTDKYYYLCMEYAEGGNL